jgi:putative nucleotidyltransferase with HDIG domain
MLKKIPTAQLQPGMFLSELCGSWMDHPFWNTRFLIEDPLDILRIVQSGVSEAWIDTDKGADVAGGVSAAEAASQNERDLLAATRSPSPIARVSAASEVVKAVKICAQARGAVVSMFQEARMGNSVDVAALAPLVDEISASVTRHPGALVSLARLKSKDDYTYMHSVAVCGLMLALARRMGLDEDTTRQAGLAGLLHDLGKAAIPLSVLNKPSKLTEVEFSKVKGHAQAGYEMLKTGGGVGAIALDVALHHHEKVDGTGYPDHLLGEAISRYAKMGAVCDVYDAITSNRPYKLGWNPAEALRKMNEWAHGHFDLPIFHAFVKSVGIYPLGSLVRLESGLLAVVTESHDNDLLKPTVKTFYCTRRRERLFPKLVDLAGPACADRILAWESQEKWQFPDLDELWRAY